MEYFIHYLENIFEEDIYFEENRFEEESEYSSYQYKLNNNNNDAYNFLLNIFLYFKIFIFSLYECFTSYIATIKHCIYRLQFTLLLIFFLFNFVIAFEDNSNLTTNLIINAYFRKKNITWFTEEMIQEKRIKKEKAFRLKENNYKKNNNTNKTKLNEIYNENNINNNGFDIEDFEEFEVKIKEKYKKYKNNNQNSLVFNHDEEIYFFNFIPIKTVFIDLFCFFLLYFIIKSTMKSKIRNSLILNLICFYTLYNLINSLYKNKYYLASNFIFILLIYISKNLIDSFYLKLKYRRRDFEIFTTNLIAINSKQLYLKLILLIIITSLSAFLSTIYFKFWLNYIVNYLCLLMLLSFIGNCIEQISPCYLKPIKNIIMFFAGIFNLILTKFILRYFLSPENICFINNNYNKNNEDNNIYVDSLYLINDLFSFFCLDYINGFFEFQIRIYLSDNKNNIFNKDNNFYLCFFFFLFWILIGDLGIYKKEFICIVISLYMTKIIMNYFCTLFHFKICRIVNCIIILKFFLLIPKISQLEDKYLINLFNYLTQLNEAILLFSFKFIFFLAFIYYIITSNFILYVDYNSIRKKNINCVYFNNNKIYILVYIIFEMFLHFSIICLIIIIYYYFENNYTMKVLYFFTLIIIHSLKIPSINEIREKNNNNDYVIDYNFYIIIWMLISLRLIKLSSSQISLIYLVNHMNLIFIINFYIINDKEKNNFMKIIIIMLLGLGYYSLNSPIFIIDAIAIIISPIIIKYKSDSKSNMIKSKNKDQRIKNETIRVYNRLTFLFLLSIILFSFLQIGNSNNYEYFYKYLKELGDNLSLLFKENDEIKIIDENEALEFYIINKFYKFFYK